METTERYGQATPRGDKPRIAVTMGDPAGVGPEIIVKGLQRPEVKEACLPVIVGEAAVLDKAGQTLQLALPPEAEVWSLGAFNAHRHRWGELSADAGRAAAAYITRAVEAAVAGEVEAIVTAPVHKEALHLAGVPYPGHTEMLAALTDTAEYTMMLAGPRLRVAHVSTHVSLEEAIRRVRKERILSVIRMAHDAVRREGVAEPKVAVAGLNPHAGEGGLFGHQDDEHIRPAVEQAVREGIRASGPHPADTVFWQALQGRYDVVIAMYHDQGHIPAKLIGFDDSVNVTLGLPIIRTSVDHGTAFDIAGRGLAREDSFVQAVLYAVKMARGGA